MDSKEEINKLEACSVSQAMNIAKQGLEQIHLTVVGEVSKVTNAQRYKAVYFDVRDESASMSCLMWKSAYAAAGIELAQGMLVEMRGKFSVYPARGDMQFQVSSLNLAGEGELRMKVARLAAKLKTEGLMEESRKRPLPFLPKRIGVITSPHGKAVHDVIRTMRRRYPIAELLFYGVKVEGADAPTEMINALAALCVYEPAPDVILLVRGGGSYESLMPFNDESLARAVAASPIPIITGIGHEPDNSLCDMCADKRASNPTAAAESATTLSFDELQEKVNNARKMLANSLKNRVAAAKHSLERISTRPIFKDSRYMLGSYVQELDTLNMRLSQAIPANVKRDVSTLALMNTQLKNWGASFGVQQKTVLEKLEAQFKSWGTSFGVQQKNSLEKLQTQINRNVLTNIDNAKSSLALNAAKLDALSPLKTLSRGYSIAYVQGKKIVVDSVKKVKLTDKLQVQVQDGSLMCSIDAIEDN